MAALASASAASFPLVNTPRHQACTVTAAARDLRKRADEYAEQISRMMGKPCPSKSHMW